MNCVQEVADPLCRSSGPDDFPIGVNRVMAFTHSEAVLPTQALLLDASRLGLRPNMFHVTGAVGLVERVAAAMRATVSSSFIAMRAKTSRTSRAAAIGSGLPFGPSGLTQISFICTAASGFSRYPPPAWRLSPSHLSSDPQ
jgi:hypothetical protein